MSVSAVCPSCGAPVVFRSTSSVFAVCAYCQSTLIRHDQNLEDIGKMAALVDDRSPLCLGSEGRYRGVHFALIGRIQIRYGQGAWNEWHLLFDDMRTGWLSEAAGEYALTFMQPVQEPLPAFAALEAGQRLQLAGQVWTVSNLEEAECIAGEGELPFKVGAGYAVPVADLRSASGFATLDYSETPPFLFVGEAVDFAGLQWKGLRDGAMPPERTVAARVFRCPACGASMQARSQDILAVGCASCGAVVDTAGRDFQLLSAAQRGAASREPRLPLGARGRLDGAPVEVIGWLVRRGVSEGVAYDWHEYLLAVEGPGEVAGRRAQQGRYRWLTEYNGHWNVADAVLSPPTRGGRQDIEQIRFEDAAFRHFATVPAAEVIEVVGEFTWRVQRGERCRVADYVAPPRLLSCESTDKELAWSLARYVEPAGIAAAFGLKDGLPDPVGVYANQPNPWEANCNRAWRLFGKAALLACALQLFFVFASPGKSLLRQDFAFQPGAAEEVRSREFTVDGRARKLAVRHATSLDNNWVALDMLLVDKTTGNARPASREIAFYRGYDDGYWSEGSRDDEVVFADVPPGTYYLTIEPEMPPGQTAPLLDRLEIAQKGAGWANFVLVLIALAVPPIFASLRRSAFETRRWMDSDHPPANAGDEED